MQNRHGSTRNDPPRGAAEPKNELADVIHRNIHSLLEVRRQFQMRKTRQDKVADAITRFAGSMPAVYLHLALFGGWLLINVGAVPGVKPFDPFPFVMLAMFASVEAIFLSTFVLISQNRSAEMDQKRAELDLQISLLSEHEVTRLIELVDAIAEHMGLHREDLKDVDQLKRDVNPETVLNEIETKERESA